MAVREILNVKDSRLRTKSRPVLAVDRRVLNLIRDLAETLEAQKDPEGVGLAAVQIGVPLRVFVLRSRGKILPIINPEIVKISRETNDPSRVTSYESQVTEKEFTMEGCLSLPHYYGPVRRARWVELRYTKPDGQIKVEKFTEFPAQIVQHELDHLEGKVFVDRLFQQRRGLFKLVGKHWEEVELP